MPKYAVARTRLFVKSVKRLLRSGRFDKDRLDNIIVMLASGKPLPQNYRDHALSGDWQGRRECHIESNLLLVYSIDEDVLVLLLINIGSHPYLFG